MDPADVLTTQPPIYGDSRWAVVASLLLLVIGILIVAFGLLQIVGGLLYDDVGGRAMGYDVIFMVTGVVLVALGILHGIVARAIWKHRPWARKVGLAISFLGALLGVYVLPSAFTPLIRSNALTGENISSGPNLLAISIVLIGAAYVVILISLVVSSRHFRTREG